jgi:hypothetical protein
MKRTVLFIAVAFWAICGFAGAWRMDDMRIKTIARGPLSLIEALNEDPISIPHMS